jgi:hypothetical protein
MRQRDIDDDDSLPVMVPRSDKTLVAISAKRVRRLRERLIEALQELRTAKHSKCFASPVRPEPTGFRGRRGTGRLFPLQRLVLQEWRRRCLSG